MIVGDGPDRLEMERRYASQTSIVWCGTRPRDAVIDLMAGSRWVVLPSLAYENFPMTVLEAFSVATPVVVPNHGAFARIVTDRLDGLMFSPGNAESLAAAFSLALASSESSWAQWSANARKKFVREFTGLSNYRQLLAIYQSALETFRISHSAARRPEMRQGVEPLARKILEESVQEHARNW